MVAAGTDGARCPVKEDSAVEIFIEGIEYFLPECAVFVLKEGLPRTLEGVAVIEDQPVKVGLGRSPCRVLDLFRSCQFPSAHPLRIEESSQEFLRGTHHSVDHWWTSGVNKLQEVSTSYNKQGFEVVLELREKRQ